MTGNTNIFSEAQPESQTVSEIVIAAGFLLKNAGKETPNLDVEVLLAFCMEKNRSWLLAHPETLVPTRVRQKFASLLERRGKGEPVAYLCGEKEFWALSFAVDKRVLIPRPETEILVEEALGFASDNFGRDRSLSILEIGTGSGAISIALARELPHADITATDISAEALEVASANATRNNVAQKIRFKEGSYFDPVTGEFDLIISNPPYIPEEEFTGLAIEIKDFEPVMALVSGIEGTECLFSIIAGAGNFLKPGGALFLEIGAFQKQKIEEIFRKEGYNRIAFRKDYSGLFRVVGARRS